MFPGAKHFIVDRLGTPVGYLMLVTLEGDRLHLIDIALTAGARGQGTGTAVLTELIAAAREEQVRWLTLSVNVTNHGAVRLYTRLGFQACDQGNEPMASREMRLDLSSIIAPTCDPDQAAKAAHQQSTPPLA
jgi:ribosomal protein S18 acetylase RimI-like enzyme